MKKTTYIIIGFLGVLALMAFVLPPVLFRKNVNPEVTISDSYTKSELPYFSAINIYGTYTYGDKPIVLVKGVADGEKAGVLELNQAWAENSSFKVEDDYLTINLSLSEKGSDSDRITYYGEDKPAVVVYVDSALFNLSCKDAMLVAENLNDADLSLSGGFDMTVNNSRIESMLFRDWENDNAGTSLVLNDTSSVDCLVVDGSEFRLSTSDSAFVDSIMLIQQRGLYIELGDSRFNVLINDGGLSGASNISLSSPATVKRN